MTIAFGSDQALIINQSDKQKGYFLSGADRIEFLKSRLDNLYFDIRSLKRQADDIEDEMRELEDRARELDREIDQLDTETHELEEELAMLEED